MTVAADVQLARILDAGSPSGAFFLHGDAVRLRDEAARELIEAALDPATKDFNYDIFRGDDLDPEELAGALAMPPMMAERRVVALFDAQKLPPRTRKTVAAALDALPSDLVFVITATIPKGSRAAFYRMLADRCRTIEWTAPRESELPGWCIARAHARHGFELAGEAAQALAAAIGSDLSLLDSELGKLAAARRGGSVDLRTVRALVPKSRRIDRWTWLDLVAARRYRKALRTLDGVLTGERGVALVAGLIEQHLFLGIALAEGASGVGRVLRDTGRGYLGWKARSYAAQAKSWEEGQLSLALRAMSRADRRLKTGGGDRAVLEELLLSLGQLPDGAQ